MILADICKEYNCKVVIEAAAKNVINEETMEIEEGSWVNNIFELFKKLRNEGKCIVVASHSINIKKYVDDIIYINKGKIRGVDKNAI